MGEITHRRVVGTRRVRTCARIALHIQLQHTGCGSKQTSPRNGMPGPLPKTHPQIRVESLGRCVQISHTHSQRHYTYERHYTYLTAKSSAGSPVHTPIPEPRVSPATQQLIHKDNVAIVTAREPTGTAPAASHATTTSARAAAQSRGNDDDQKHTHTEHKDSRSCLEHNTHTHTHTYIHPHTDTPRAPTSRGNDGQPRSAGLWWKQLP